MKFVYLTVVLILLISATKLSHGNCIVEQKGIDSSGISAKKSSQGRFDMKKSTDTLTMEHLEKLIAEAEEIKDLYEELMRTIFGPKFQISTEQTVSMGNPRKAATEWVRAAIDASLLHKRNQDQKLKTIKMK